METTRLADAGSSKSHERVSPDGLSCTIKSKNLLDGIGIPNFSVNCKSISGEFLSTSLAVTCTSGPAPGFHQGSPARTMFAPRLGNLKTVFPPVAFSNHSGIIAAPWKVTYVSPSIGSTSSNPAFSGAFHICMARPITCGFS